MINHKATIYNKNTSMLALMSSSYVDRDKDMERLWRHIQGSEGDICAEQVHFATYLFFFSDCLKVGVIGEKCIPAQQQHLLIIKRELTYGSNSDMGYVICKLSKKQRRYDLILAMVTENGELDTIPPVQSLW